MPIERHTYLSDVWKDSLFADRVVFCTGGAGTICSAQVRGLVALGANACIVGRNVEKTEKAAKDLATARSGAKVIGIGGVDVRKLDSLEKAVARCVEELGSLDFCIAGAAGNFLASIENLSSNAFKSVIDIDVLGSYNTLKATLPHLIKSAADPSNRSGADGESKPPHNTTGGRIIFVSATLHYTGTPFQTHVGAAKAAIDALSNNVALEYGPRGMTSNIIAPGLIVNTEGAARLVVGGDSGEKNSIKQIPTGRGGTIRDIADATVYLFSSAGSHVNGTSQVVDGGSWRIGHMMGLPYPDFLLTGEEVQGVAGMKKSKL